MGLREEVKKAVDSLGEEELSAVMEYLRFLVEPEEVEPTEEEVEAVARGRRERAAGEVVKWRDV